MTIVLAIATAICGIGWFFASATTEVMVKWMKGKGLEPTDQELQILTHEVINRRFGINKK